MSVGLYDQAFLDKLNNWTKDTEIRVYGQQELRRVVETIADTDNDQISLPIIILRRLGGFNVLNTGKRPLAFDGATLDANHNIASQLNAIPIQISYQLDVYTRYFEEADQYARNLVFNIINYPKLDILIPYNDENRTHHSYIRLQGEVEDNSDIPERFIPGQFSRISMKIDIDDAYLFDVRYRDVYSLEITSSLSDNSIKDDLQDIKLV